MAANPESEDPNSWEELLKRMLPEGAPLPDEDQLDYSISVDYVAPSPFFNPPTIDPMIPKSRFTAFPKQAPSLTPRNPAWVRSRSSSEATSSDYKCLSNSSIALDDDNCSDGGIETVLEPEPEPEPEQEPTRDRHDPQLRINGGCGGIGRGCNRCGKGINGLLRSRERCIVCGAEYCKRCVLKAMGEMSEGRKCIGCIGKAIDEANRGRLGRGSRLLSKLFNRFEVQHIMQVERGCKANQLRPEQIVLNGKELREEELDELFGCPIDLKPGRYWYDKDSGLWGKEGEKPERIITSKLNVGGKLQVGASNGDTRVYMNGREITKVELRVLKLAKVQCPPDTHFWLYDDGSYEEEGQNNIKGNIWEKVRKASVRFICSLFSLAVPSERAQYTMEEPATLSDRLDPEYLEQHRVQKLLLLGLEGSGTSTIFKQAKFLYTRKFNPEELMNIKFIIQSNMYRYLSILLEGREHFEEEVLMNEVSAGLAADRSVPGERECDGIRQCIYSVSQKINNFCDWLLDLMTSGDFDTFFPAAAREYSPVVDEIWKDPAIQETYKRREELASLPDVSGYFLDRVMEISSNEYELSEQDILFAEGITPTNGLASIEFSFDNPSAVSELYGQDSPNKYQLILLKAPVLGWKCLDKFDNTNAVIICVSLSDYNQNKMLANRDFFERVAQCCFEETPFVLLLTKYDVFEGKIEQVPITTCEWFRDFDPIKTHGKSHSSLGHQAFHYIAVKFKELYASITGRKLYVRLVKDHEQQSVDEALRYVREIIDWEEHKVGGLYGMSDEDDEDLLYDAYTSNLFMQ